MALIDIKIPSKEILVSEGNTFTVRGITFEGLDYLMSVNAKEVNALAAMLATTMDQSIDEADKSSAQMMAMIQTTRPQLAAQIIACASGDCSAEAVTRALQLPVPVQADALNEITRLTFEVNGGIKKFIELLLGTLILLRNMSQGIAA